MVEPTAVWEPLLREVGARLAEGPPLGRGPLLLAVSGGADSTALAVLCAALRARGRGPDLVLAHVDHGWRPVQEERERVWRLGERLGVAVCFLPPPGGRLGDGGGAGPSDADPLRVRRESCARTFRMQSLATAAHACGADAVATAHHSLDQAETILGRLLRGSGWAGMAGIPPYRRLCFGGPWLLRPLLGIAPGALKALLRAQGIPWVEDPANADPAFERVGLRSRLARARPETLDALAALAGRRFRERLVRVARVRSNPKAEVVHWPLAQGTSLSRQFVARLSDHGLSLLLGAVGKRWGAEDGGPWLTKTHVARIKELARGPRQGALDVPGNMRLLARGRRIWVYRRDELPSSEPRLRVRRVREGVHLGSGGRVASRRVVAHLPLAEIPLAAKRLRLRRLLRNDRFCPQGAAAGHSVSATRWLTKQGIPAFVRQRQWVVADEEGPLWLVGLRLDRRVATPTATRGAVRLEVQPGVVGPSAPSGRAPLAARAPAG